MPAQGVLAQAPFEIVTPLSPQTYRAQAGLTRMLAAASAHCISHVTALRVPHDHRPQVHHLTACEHLPNHEALLPVARPASATANKPVVVRVDGLGPRLPRIVSSGGVPMSAKVCDSHVRAAQLAEEIDAPRPSAFEIISRVVREDEKVAASVRSN
eukprot:CAMPEP_0183337972 /NCGR_PEP_ID=MMETSP0164_2-20130417/5430_1 /TAXON_ID=221442 /ORGANISM="Coccolithus pelagicus ssp braarudi, Strain PLY182g" /LENGTH=155 /DNA_ID=CAMNT_0025507745 /DNA_START=406 /DNA_END=871 /DNA_ORIENTATION=+